jgi:putative oxidoreductase
MLAGCTGREGSAVSRLPIVLLALRLSIFGVMLTWTLDKFLHPGHAAGVYAYFYQLRMPSAAVIRSLGALELLLLAGFVLGYRKRLTYGAVFLLHGASTLSAYRQYLAPWHGANLLFFAAWPMWAACWTLYLLRDADKKLTL